MANVTLSDLEIKEYEITPGGMKELQAELAALKRSRNDIAGEIREISSQSNNTGFSGGLNVHYYPKPGDRT